MHRHNGLLTENTGCVINAGRHFPNEMNCPRQESTGASDRARVIQAGMPLQPLSGVQQCARQRPARGELIRRRPPPRFAGAFVPYGQ